MPRILSRGLVLTVCVLSNVQAQEKPLSAAQELVESARRNYQDRILEALDLRLAPPAAIQPARKQDPLLNEDMAETLHKWSIRWMEAEASMAANRDGRIAAAHAHLDRMKALESGKMFNQVAGYPPAKDFGDREKELADVGVEELEQIPDWDPRHFNETSRYFRLEAEILVAREKKGDRP